LPTLTDTLTERVEKLIQPDPTGQWGDVFCRENGTPLDPRGISQAFQVRRKAAGLPTLNLHGLRHTNATHLAHYTHSLDELSTAAAEALADVIDTPRLRAR
jgi:integrase